MINDYEATKPITTDATPVSTTIDTADAVDQLTRRVAPRIVRNGDPAVKPLFVVSLPNVLDT